MQLHITDYVAGNKIAGSVTPSKHHVSPLQGAFKDLKKENEALRAENEKLRLQIVECLKEVKRERSKAHENYNLKHQYQDKYIALQEKYMDAMYKLTGTDLNNSYLDLEVVNRELKHDLIQAGLAMSEPAYMKAERGGANG
jgi:predicted nuclease with TOPRIM domain